jgi:ABC-2 type transport system permease protein
MIPLVKAAFIVGINDFRALYTWRTWLFGWLLRVIFQVLFFALIGRYLGKPATCTYLFAIFLSAVMAKARSGRWVALNVGYIGLTAVCGFLIPIGFWPAPAGWLAQILPYTHALEAIRGLVIGGVPASTIVRDAGLELAAIAGWFTAARVAFGLSVERARRDGTIDLAVG